MGLGPAQQTSGTRALMGHRPRTPIPFPGDQTPPSRPAKPPDTPPKGPNPNPPGDQSLSSRPAKLPDSPSKGPIPNELATITRDQTPAGMSEKENLARAAKLRVQRLDKDEHKALILKKIEEDRRIVAERASPIITSPKSSGTVSVDVIPRVPPPNMPSSPTAAFDDKSRQDAVGEESIEGDRQHVEERPGGKIVAVKTADVVVEGVSPNIPGVGAKRIAAGMSEKEILARADELQVKRRKKGEEQESIRKLFEEDRRYVEDRLGGKIIVNDLSEATRAGAHASSLSGGLSEEEKLAFAAELQIKCRRKKDERARVLQQFEEDRRDVDERLHGKHISAGSSSAPATKVPGPVTEKAWFGNPSRIKAEEQDRVLQLFHEDRRRFEERAGNIISVNNETAAEGSTCMRPRASSGPGLSQMYAHNTEENARVVQVFQVDARNSQERAGASTFVSASSAPGVQSFHFHHDPGATALVPGPCASEGMTRTRRGVHSSVMHQGRASVQQADTRMAVHNWSATAGVPRTRRGVPCGWASSGSFTVQAG